MKCCTKCKVEKDIQSFQKFKKNTKFGFKEYYKSQCKECTKSHRKEYFSNYNNPNPSHLKHHLSICDKNRCQNVVLILQKQHHLLKPLIGEAFLEIV